MSQTRQDEFIKFIEDGSKQAVPSANFLDELKVRVGGLVNDNIDWGASTFTGTFSEKLLKNSLISDQAMFVILNGLLESRKPFDEGPLRQPHLFSHLYAELLKRHVIEFAKESAALPDHWHTLNRKMLQLYIKMFPKKGAEEATYNCINNFLYMRFDVLKLEGLALTDKEKADVQTLFFNDVKFNIQENDNDIAEKKVKNRMEGFMSKPGTPIPQRKQLQITADRAPHKAGSTPKMFGPHEEPPGKSQSSSGKLEQTDRDKLTGRGSSGNK